MKRNIPQWLDTASRLLHGAVILVSVLLIVYVSYDILNGIALVNAKRYLNFQLFVCIIFLTSLAVDWHISQHKCRFFFRNLLFFLVSIPYLNIIHSSGIVMSEEAYTYVRFIPLIRSAFALAMVVGYLSKNKLNSLFTSYLIVLLAGIYFASLIFYKVEYGVNAEVTSFPLVIWCAFMNVTTLGSPVVPATAVGKIIYVFLGFLGMTMLPLFTVYVSNLIKSKPHLTRPRNKNNEVRVKTQKENSESATS